MVELLWRDGFVPEWVDLAVVGLTEKKPFSMRSAAGGSERLSSCSTSRTPGWPRSVRKGPSLPVNYVDGVRFSIYERSSLLVGG